MISNPDHTFLDVNTKYSENPFQLMFYHTFPTAERLLSTDLSHAAHIAPHCEVFIGAPYDSEYARIPDDKFPYDCVTRSLTYLQTTATKLLV